MLPSRLVIGVAIVGLVAGTIVSGQTKSAPAKPASGKASAKEAAAPAGPVLVFNFVRGIGSSKKVVGTVELETFPAEAPKSVAHIVDLVKNKFYNGLRVH